MAKKPTISLCMIVRNEEKHIEQCLRSVKDVVDEIIIVDTGSTDQTVPICRKFEANILSFPWSGDFAAARNKSIEHATGDWIFYLDADETLDHRAHKKIKQMVKKTNAIVLTCTILNYYGSSLPVNDENAFTIQQPRFFRNQQGIYFNAPIHETIQRKQPFSKGEVDHMQATIHHTGYIEEIAKEKEKKNRNLSLLLEQLEHPDHSPWIEYHVASEYYRLHQYEIALLLVNASIVRFIDLLILPPALLYMLKYAIFIETKQFENAILGVEKAIQLYPDYVDLHYYKGIIQYHLGKHKEAIITFNHCLRLGDGHSKYLSLKGAGSFKAKEWKEKCKQK